MFLLSRMYISILMHLLAMGNLLKSRPLCCYVIFIQLFVFISLCTLSAQYHYISHTEPHYQLIQSVFSFVTYYILCEYFRYIDYLPALTTHTHSPTPTQNHNNSIHSSLTYYIIIYRTGKNHSTFIHARTRLDGMSFLSTNIFDG